MEISTKRLNLFLKTQTFELKKGNSIHENKKIGKKH